MPSNSPTLRASSLRPATGIEPVSGQKFLTQAQIASADSNYLATELPGRLADSPIRFKMAIQIAEPGDRSTIRPSRGPRLANR